MRANRILPAVFVLLAFMSARAEVILQFFEGDWDEVHRRTVEIGEIGYDGIWIPSPCKSPVAGNNKWANVGYSLYDRFDLGDIPQRGTVATRYGTRGDLRHMVDHLHYSDVKVYPDIVFNHNGNGPNMLEYPGMKINDFHAWPDAGQPGGWRRAPRMSGYDDISGGYGQTFQQELVSLIDLVTEPDGRFGVPEPTPFVRHPGQYDKYPHLNPGDTLPNENVREMMNRWAHWLGFAMDYDGFRLDAGKHVVREFYGYGGQTGRFLHEAQWNFDQRRGNTYDGQVPDLYRNEVRRKDMLMFNEIFAGGSSVFDYWRQGQVKMRYLDFPAKQQLVGEAFSNGNLGTLASLGVALDPTEGVSFVHSHDQSGPNKMDLAYAWLLTRTGVPVVYFSGNNISWADKNAGRTWVLPGTGNALGDYNNVIANLVYIHNQFARGREWNRYADSDFYAHERYVDGYGPNANAPDSGEGVLLVALNDGGYDQTKTLQTAFPAGTVLKDYTGNQPANVTVNGSGQVTITVPARGGQGFVCYAPYVAEASGEGLRFSTGGTPVGTVNWVVPGGRDAAAKARTLPRLTGNSVDIALHYLDPVGGAVADAVVKWGQGRNLNAGAADFTGEDVVKGGFEQASYDSGSGTWRLTADLTNVPEGLHLVKGRLFNGRAAGLPGLYQTFSKAVYVDRRGPDLVIDSPVDASNVNGDVIAVIRNPDRTAGRLEWRIDGGAWSDAVQVNRGVWKASLSGLAAGARTLEVRASEYDHAASPAVINTSAASRAFTVAAPALAAAISHAEGASINLPFFTTTMTVPAGTTLGNVKLFWDGYEMAGLSLNGTTVSHTFDGRYVSGGVEQRLSGSFTNGRHFFEARVTNGGNTRVLTRSVVFNLYGANLTDSDGDGIPDDVELPGFTNGQYASQGFPGDGNEDTIPNYGENWTRLNPLNENTNYAGSWDGDEDWDNDGVSNLAEVREGYLQQGNAFHFNIYNAGSKPAANVASTASWTLVPGVGTSQLNIYYRPNNGPLAGQASIEVKVIVDGGSAQYFALASDGNGNWTYSFAVPSGADSVDLSFQTPGGGLTDSNLTWSGIDVSYTPPSFAMNGLLDSANYLVVDNGMRVWAAVRGTKLYMATWSSQGGSSDHFLLLSNNFGNPEAHPWGKAGVLNFWFAGWPWLAGEGGDTFHALSNGGAGGRKAMGAGGNVLEAEIDLIEVFGSVPKILYFSALAYGDNNGDGISSQCPAPWTADNNLQIPEYAAVRVDSIRDEDLDGYHDAGAPTFQSTVNGATADANYGLRRFFLDERAGETAQITFRFAPNANPGETVSDVEVLTNLNRREKASITEDRAAATTSSDTYYRAHPMTLNAGVYEATLPVERCGAYRATIRYRLDGQTYIYTDGGLRRDLAIVVSPSKALGVNMYEVNPAIVEATSDTFSGRSTFRDLWMANTDRPDIVNKDHFTNLGVNMLWLQPIHPIGVDGRENDPATPGQPYEPGSPYAVRDYWKVASSLAADNSDTGAMIEFQQAVAALDEVGVGVMMDGTFNHSAPDAVMGQGGATLFPSWAVAGSEIRNLKPQWYSKTGNFLLPASSAADVAVAPDRSDFGKWNDVRDFYFGNYDTLVKYASASHQQEFLLERDDLEPLSPDTRDLWNYFAYYPLYWLNQTGHPAGTPLEESEKGIDGLRCDFAQGLPSQFWEYCINKTRSVKWDFLFMAESLDGYREVNGSKRHGVGYRSARHFDILNENIVFYWRDTYFAYPANGAGSAGTAVKTTANTFNAYANRREAFEGIVLLNNLTSHDEVFPSNDTYEMLQAYAQVSSLDGIPMMMYGQEAGAQNDFTAYGFSGVLNANRNWTRYETNFGKTIPNFKRWNDMSRVWQNRDWTLQGLYGRINRARIMSPALRSRSDYFLSRTGGAGWNPDILAVAKFETAGAPAASQDVVFAFVNNDHVANSNRPGASYDVSATVPGGANWFGIEPLKSYNLVNLLATDPSAPLPGYPRTGADLIANGLYVALNQPVTSLGQAQYLRLVDTSVALDSDFDTLPDSWETANTLDPFNPNGGNGPDRDVDSDGMTNWEEWFTGTLPRQAASVLRVAIAGTVTEENGELTWPSLAGRTYVLQRAPALPAAPGDWQTVYTAVATGSTMSWIETSPVDHAVYRVVVTP